VKKNLTCFLVLVFVFSIMAVPVWAAKAGEIKDDIYTDNEYGFSFAIPAGWSANVKKAKYVLRVALDQKSPTPPRQFQGDLRDYMQIPAIKVLVDTTSLTVDQFVDSLLDPDFKSKQKKGLLKSLDLISKPYDIQKKGPLTFQGAKAYMIEARQSYSMEVSSSGSDRADVINDYKSGAIFLTVREGRVYIFHFICEYQTSEPIFKIFNGLINSLNFGGADEEPAADTTG
jgi:hypothetical protein